MKTQIKQKAIRRLRIAAGQIKGLERMIEGGKYCIDIINQSRAVKEALSSFEDLVLENHLSTHVIEQVRGGNSKKAIREILSISRLSRKK